MQPIIETQHLSKSFKGRQAVDDLSFTIRPGDVYGFLGQNGAGKSTTMRMLLGLIFPDSGKIFINGTEFSNGRRHLLAQIGAIIERPDLYGYLSGWDNLRIFAALSNKHIKAARLHEVLELVGLKGREKDKVKTYSQGMKQRMGIAIALVHNPALLILDEPTNGLDPQGIAEMRKLVQTLSSEHGRTILLSSHLLHEVEQIATQMLVIHRGKKVVEGAVKDLLNPDETLVEVATTSPLASQALAASAWGQQVEKAGQDAITFRMNSRRIPELNKWLVDQGIAITGIRSKHSLEDYFLSLTND